MTENRKLGGSNTGGVMTENLVGQTQILMPCIHNIKLLMT